MDKEIFKNKEDFELADKSLSEMIKWSRGLVDKMDASCIGLDVDTYFGFVEFLKNQGEQPMERIIDLDENGRSIDENVEFWIRKARELQSKYEKEVADVALKILYHKSRPTAIWQPDKQTIDLGKKVVEKTGSAALLEYQRNTLEVLKEFKNLALLEIDMGPETRKEMKRAEGLKKSIKRFDELIALIDNDPGDEPR